MNFFQRFRAKRTDENELAANESPPLSKEEKTEATDPIKPIQVNDAQYVSLTRALRPKIERALRDLQVDMMRSNVPAVVGGASKPPPANPSAFAPDEPPNGPIV